MRILIIILFLVSSFLFSCEKKQTSPALFELLSPAQTHVNFANTLTETEDFNIIEYLYFYNGAGVAVGDINNDSLPDIYLAANQGANHLYLNQGNRSSVSFSFEDITARAGVEGEGNWTTGVSMADVNGDGWLDIYVCQVSNFKSFTGSNQLFINNKDGTFSEKAVEYGLNHQGLSTQAAFFDYDADGDLDMYLLCHSVHSNSTYKDAGMRQTQDKLAGDKLFRNDGPEKGFVDVTNEAGIFSSPLGYGLGIAIGDINSDGFPDIYVSNDFHENDYLYYNNGDGSFTEILSRSMGHTSYFSMGNDLADINNDAKPDLVTLDMKPLEEKILKNSVGADAYDIFEFKIRYGYHYQYPRNALQLNMGQLDGKINQFAEIAQLSGIAATDWSWSALLADLDNDGWKDLFVTNGILRRPNDLDYLKFISNPLIQQKATNLELAEAMPSGAVPNVVFKNNGNLIFKDVSKAWGLNQEGCSNGAAYADFDNDGDLDLVVNNINEAAYILRNRSETLQNNHFLQLRLKGLAGNTSGIGTKVLLYANGAVQYQELSPVRGFMSSVDNTLHFGLGATIDIDSLKVIWPGGSVQLLKDIAADQTLILEQNNANSIEKSQKIVFAASDDDKNSPLFQEATREVSLAFKHQEDHFYDINREKLMPHMLSAQGPYLAKADVNKDGLDDFYVGGGKNQAGRLFIQTKEGKFMVADTAVWMQDAKYEDVGTAFFDADGDGDEDLYIASGGNEYFGKADALLDRLYLNDGKGNFRKSLESLPLVYENTSCVSPADFDGDGDIDLFAGTRSVATQYGISPKSYLLENNGKGKFKISDQLDVDGMVTDAAWADVDNDRKQDLIVVGEWMPIQIFYNRNRHFEKKVIPNTSGWWNTIIAADMNGDGNIDLIGGNEGQNSNLQPTVEAPISLYVKDFDNNGTTDPVMTYFRQGKEYTYAGKDELAMQLVALKKKYPDYSPFSESSFQDIFAEDQLRGAIKKEAVLFASVYLENIGDGKFKVHPLPMEAQFSPIKSVVVEDLDEDGHLDMVVGGNSYESQPSIGRYDASFGLWLKGNPKGNFTPVMPSQSGLFIKGQVRDMECLRTASGKEILIIGKNNDSLQIIKIRKPKVID